MPLNRHRSSPATIIWIVFALCLAIGLAKLTACTPPAPTPAPSSVENPQALEALAGLHIEPEQRDGYRRADWPHWTEEAGSCLNTRERVLIRQSLEAARLSVDGCTVMSGLWEDFYTGQRLTDPKQLDIDHLVPLEEAYQSGGYRWNRERRKAYANDLNNRDALIAVTVSANRSKGAKGPEEWLPPLQSHRCAYMQRWIKIKALWELSIDAIEASFLRSALQECALAN